MCEARRCEFTDMGLRSCVFQPAADPVLRGDSSPPPTAEFPGPPWAPPPPKPPPAAATVTKTVLEVTGVRDAAGTVAPPERAQVSPAVRPYCENIDSFQIYWELN